MTSKNLTEIYLAIVDQLNSDPYIEMIYFNSAPDDHPLPYAVITPTQENTFSTFTSDHADLTIDINIYGKLEAGMSELLLMDQDIYRNLNRQIITADDWVIYSDCTHRGVPQFNDTLNEIVSTYRVIGSCKCQDQDSKTQVLSVVNTSGDVLHRARWTFTKEITAATFAPTGFQINGVDPDHLASFDGAHADIVYPGFFNSGDPWTVTSDYSGLTFTLPLETGSGVVE